MVNRSIFFMHWLSKVVPNGQTAVLPYMVLPIIGRFTIFLVRQISLKALDVLICFDYQLDVCVLVYQKEQIQKGCRIMTS